MKIDVTSAISTELVILNKLATLPVVVGTIIGEDSGLMKVNIETMVDAAHLFPSGQLVRNTSDG
jgi:hypothetical protein